MRKQLYFLGCLLILLSGCTEDNENYFASRDKDYYPLISGAFNVYSVTEINIDTPSEVFDTTEYQLKEMIGGTFIDDEGKQAYLMLRYKRNNNTQEWSISDVWSVQYNNQRLFITEENIRYVKMYLPLLLGKTWDGNTYNTMDETVYEITGLDEAQTINNQAFDSCLTVTQEFDSSLIHKNIVYEQFARDTGLIYKEITHLNAEIIPGEDFENRITQGTIYKQIFIERGKDENYAEE